MRRRWLSTLVLSFAVAAPAFAAGADLTVRAYVEYGLDRTRHHLRGAAGYNGDSAVVGIKGFKSVQTVTAESLNLSPSSSSVQVFASLRL